MPILSQVFNKLELQSSRCAAIDHFGHIRTFVIFEVAVEGYYEKSTSFL